MKNLCETIWKWKKCVRLFMWESASDIVQVQVNVNRKPLQNVKRLSISVCLFVSQMLAVKNFVYTNGFAAICRSKQRNRSNSTFNAINHEPALASILDSNSNTKISKPIENCVDVKIRKIDEFYAKLVQRMWHTKRFSVLIRKYKRSSKKSAVRNRAHRICNVWIFHA